MINTQILSRVFTVLVVEETIWMTNRHTADNVAVKAWVPVTGMFHVMFECVNGTVLKGNVAKVLGSRSPGLLCC